MKRPETNPKEATIVAIVALVVLVISLTVVWFHRPMPVQKVVTNNGTITANPNVPGGTNENPTSGSGGSKDSSSDQPGTTLEANVIPAKPTGQFVSNHHPNLSGSPAPNTETSTCSTTPGAYCKIMFMNGTTTKTLPPQKTNADGNVIWTDWTLQSVGLTDGTWQVTAVSFNGNNSASTHDATLLTVTP